MQTSVNTNVERIIAKIDNDFNPDNSDWIPRVGAWVIDAMGQVNALRKVRKKIKLNVSCNIAYSNCDINSPNLVVTDCDGCEIIEQRSHCHYSTGDLSVTPSTVSSVNTCHDNAPNMIAETINGEYPERYNYKYVDNQVPKTYVLIGKNKLELSFNTDFVYVETEVVETEISEYYGCEIPVIPDVPILIEAVAYYCVYKMLLRGSKHPVFNLTASQYGTNPYFEWNKLKPEAKRGVIIFLQGNLNVKDNNLFQSVFFVSTFK